MFKLCESFSYLEGPIAKNYVQIRYGQVYRLLDEVWRKVCVVFRRTPDIFRKNCSINRQNFHVLQNNNGNRNSILSRKTIFFFLKIY